MLHRDQHQVCQSVADAHRDLAEKIGIVEEIAHSHGMLLFWSGTHPFSRWQDQIVTQSDRYLDLIDLLQETARRIITFGLHVHVGVDSGDKAIMICDRILQHLPTLLALSANSPFWQGRNTGLHSQRSKIMETLPTAGLPPLMRNWSEYVWLLNNMVETGFIKTIRELWWDVRPHHNFGTVEVRICDMPPSLDARPRNDGPDPVPGPRPFRGNRPGDISVRLPPVPDPAEQVASMPLRDGCQAGRRRHAPGRAGAGRRPYAGRAAGRPRSRARLRPLPRELHDMADEPTGSVLQLQTFQETNNLAEVVPANGHV